MKKLKTHDLDGLDLYDSLDNIIKQLEQLKEKYSEYENLRIDEESAYEGGYYYYLRGDRLETDEEESLREKYETENLNRIEENQRKQYEILKAKFEPS